MAAEVAPRWAEAAPQCVVADGDGGDGIVATRCEARVQPAHEDAALVLVDVVDLQVPSSAAFMAMESLHCPAALTSLRESRDQA